MITFSKFAISIIRYNRYKNTKDYENKRGNCSKLASSLHKRSLEDFGEYILLTNFNKYVELFAEKFGVPVLGRDANMISASAEGMTIINFGMGSPNAAIIMDLLGAIQPKACLFLGKCGGIDKKK